MYGLSSLIMWPHTNLDRIMLLAIKLLLSIVQVGPLVDLLVTKTSRTGVIRPRWLAWQTFSAPSIRHHSSPALFCVLSDPQHSSTLV